MFFCFLAGGGGGGGVEAQTRVTRPNLRASFEVNLCPILKLNTLLQSSCRKLNDDGLLMRIQREMIPWWSFESSRHFPAHNADRNGSDYTYLRALFEVNVRLIKKKYTVAKAL